MHTPTPWEVLLTEWDEVDPIDPYAWGGIEAGGEEIARLSMEANADRIVACVNHCEGINPEAVPELIESLDALLTDPELFIEDTDPYPSYCRVCRGGPVFDDWTRNGHAEDCSLIRVRAALAKARGEIVAK